MPDDTYFLRMRGRVTGPFELAEMRRMVRLGLVSRVHEVSTDRETWSPAASVPHLFEVDRSPAGPPPGPPPLPPPPPEAAEPAVTAAEISDYELVAQPAADTLAAPAGSADLYYYSHDGITQGPVSFADLRTLASTGALAQGDLVWRPGDAEAQPAAQLLPVAAVEPVVEVAPVSAEAVRRPGSGSSGDTMRNGVPDRLFRRIGRLSLAEGICAGVLLVFCAMVPHTRAAGALVWWWRLWRQPGGILLFMLALYVLVAAPVLVFMAIRVKGLARAWTNLVVSGVGLCLLVLATTAAEPGSVHLGLAALAPGLLGALIAASLLKRLGLPGTPCGMVSPMADSRPQVILAGLVCGVALIGMVVSVIGLMGLRRDGAMPTWVVFSLLVSVMAWLAALGSGVTGLVAGLARPVDRVVVLLGIAGLGTLALAAVIVGFGLVGRVTPFALVQVLRLVVVAYTLGALAAVGLAEMLALSLWLEPELVEDD